MDYMWFIRLPFAIVFAGHGMGKLLMPWASAEMLGLPVVLVVCRRRVISDAGLEPALPTLTSNVGRAAPAEDVGQSPTYWVSRCSFCAVPRSASDVGADYAPVRVLPG